MALEKHHEEPVVYLEVAEAPEPDISEDRVMSEEEVLEASRKDAEELKKTLQELTDKRTPEDKKPY